MQIKKRFQINVALSVITAVVMVFVLFLALQRVKHAMQESEIAGEILTSAFDRSVLRDDYLRNNNERAKMQWLAKHEQISRLLKSASEKFKEAGDKVIIDKLIKDQESTGKLFSAIVENREKTKSGEEWSALAQETENRLVSQMSMRLYDKVLYVRMLREVAEERLFSSLRRAGWGIIILITIVAAAAIINSWTMGRAIADRIRRLRDGASAIGAGNLDHRIDIKGNDEFADFSESFNAMTAKLQASYHDLENEITVRKQTEELLWENEGRLKKAQEIAHLGSWELDVVNNILTWSDEVYRIFGLQPREFDATYEAFLEAVHPDDRAAVDAAYSGSLREGRDTYEIEHRVVRKSTGEIRYVHEKCEHARDETGGIIRSAGMVQDITERRRAEEEREKLITELRRSNRELEQFAYVASHDLQEPLRMVASYTALLEKRYKKHLDERAHQYIDFAVEGAERMQKLIEALLAYSRITRRGAEFKPVDLDKVFSVAVSNLSAAIQESRAEITKDHLPVISGDETQLVQLLQNLIGNGVKYKKPDVQPVLHVSAEKIGQEYLFTVHDNGIGIEPRYYDKVFQIFQRLHDRDQYPGTGIGLALCKRIVERHRGRIWIESRPGEGSTFFFTMPG